MAAGWRKRAHGNPYIQIVKKEGCAPLSATPIYSIDIFLMTENKKNKKFYEHNKKTERHSPLR